VLNPADSLDDGQQVNVKEIAQKPAAAPAAPSSAPAQKETKTGARN
jgi:hypothetical protein